MNWKLWQWPAQIRLLQEQLTTAGGDAVKFARQKTALEQDRQAQALHIGALRDAVDAARKDYEETRKEAEEHKAHWQAEVQRRLGLQKKLEDAPKGVRIEFVPRLTPEARADALRQAPDTTAFRGVVELLDEVTVEALNAVLEEDLSDEKRRWRAGHAQALVRFKEELIGQIQDAQQAAQASTNASA